MNPTLVSGFEDIITHIKQQEQRIMSLEEENKKLKVKYEKGVNHVITLQEELNEESQQRLKNKECWMSVQKQYHKLKDENKKLKEEIKKLKEDDPVEKEFKDAMEDLEKKIKELGGWSPTSSKEPVQDQ
jgi:chromosome segregation ATPase